LLQSKLMLHYARTGFVEMALDQDNFQQSKDLAAADAARPASQQRSNATELFSKSEQAARMRARAASMQSKMGVVRPTNVFQTCIHLENAPGLVGNGTHIMVPLRQRIGFANGRKSFSPASHLQVIVGTAEFDVNAQTGALELVLHGASTFFVEGQYNGKMTYGKLFVGPADEPVNSMTVGLTDGRDDRLVRTRPSLTMQRTIRELAEIPPDFTMYQTPFEELCPPETLARMQAVWQGQREPGNPLSQRLLEVVNTKNMTAAEKYAKYIETYTLVSGMVSTESVYCISGFLNNFAATGALHPHDTDEVAIHFHMALETGNPIDPSTGANVMGVSWWDEGLLVG